MPAKAKNAQEAHEAIRPTSFRARPETDRAHLDSDQARLYELIWKRAMASQMESAELERTTVDAVSDDGKVTLRATGTVTLFDGFSRSTGRPGRRGRRGRRRLPQVEAGDAADDREGHAGAAFHRTAAALFRSQPGAKARRTRHRPALDLCHHPVRRCATAPMCAWTATVSSRKTRAGSSRLSSTTSSAAMSNMISPPTWKRSSTRFPPATSTWKTAAAGFLEGFFRRDRRDQGTQDLAGDHRARRSPRTAHLPAERRWRRSAQMPGLRQRPAAASSSAASAPLSAARTIPNAATPARSGQTAERSASAAQPQVLGDDPADRRTDHAAHRPLRSLRAARRRREAGNASAFPKAWTAPQVDLDMRAEAAVAAARRGQPSRRRQDDHGQFRPLRALCRP